MRARGQASIEFVLVLIFMLVIVSAVVLPLGQRMQYAMEDVSSAGFISRGLDRVVSTTNLMSAVPGGTRLTIEVYFPSNTTFVCNPLDNNVGFIFPLHTDVFDAGGQPPVECDETFSTPEYGMRCSKYFVFPPTIDLHCQGNALTGYAVDSGEFGYAQSFIMRSKFVAGNSPPYTLDFNAG